MTILSTDIRLLESERMTDNTDGGGRRTNRVIPDGIAGNVFPKVSRVDSVYGRVNLRKVFPHVNTNNLDVYAGAHFIISDAPDNDRISVLAFNTGSDFDLRGSARDRIESYVIAGPEGRPTVYGRQLKGAGAILIYQRVEEPLPEVGEVYALSTEVGDVTLAQQFVRVQKIETEVRTFTDSLGDFQRRAITLTIGAPLRFEFKGVAAASRYQDPVAAKFRTTTVADAARYWGIKPLVGATNPGDFVVTVSSVYEHIVPSTQREAPVNLASIAGASAVQAAASDYLPVVTVNTTPNSYTLTAKTISAVTPGKFKIRARIVNSYTAEVEAQENGIIPPFGNGQTVFSGFVVYETGEINLTLSSIEATGDSAVEFRYIPAAEVIQPSHTKQIPITLATRGTVHSVPLLPIPAPGTLIVDYRALGKWYRLRDYGMGELNGGDSRYGTGTVNYVTGGSVVTLGELPDVGSSILYSWGSPVHHEIRVTDAGNSAFQDFILPDVPVKDGAVTITYLSDGTPYTITDTAGVLSGGATGTINYLTGAVHLEYGTRLPDFDSTISTAYMQRVVNPIQSLPGGGTGDATGVSTVGTGNAVPTSTTTFTLPGPATPGTAVGTLTAVSSTGARIGLEYRANSDGSVTLTRASLTMGDDVYIYRGVSSPLLGSINHATGVITVTTVYLTFVNKDYSTVTYEWYEREITSTILLDLTTTSNYTYTPASVPVVGPGGTESVATTSLAMIDTPKTYTRTLETEAPIRVDLTRTSTSQVVPGSVQFSMAGKTFIDRNGTLYVDISPTTGSGTAAGTINYTTGVATTTLWARGAAVALAVQSCLVKFGDFKVTSMFFRTAGSPIRPASLFIQCTAADGELLTGTSDQNGLVTGTHMTGRIEQNMGVVGLSFGKMVTAAGKELEPWYDVANVVAGMIFEPREVLPGTLRYSAVVLSNLPLDAEILGLDPVRLPSDGRVPIYRPADVVVLHHTDTYNAGTPTEGAVLNVGRGELSLCWLEDSARKKLAPDLYDVNLVTGAVTLATPLDLTGYAPPIAVRHRIEEMGLLSDVQINGQLTLSAPLLRSFPLGSYASGALLYGDLQARVTNLFDQETWTNEWSSALIGNGATAQYNDIDWPVEVLNHSAVTERWRIRFTSTTAFQVIGENLGVIATGTTSADISVDNALTGLPYFVLRKNGWGSGWSVGNQLRFDTISAAPPTWLARTILPGATLAGDSFDAQLRGDVD